MAALSCEFILAGKPVPLSLFYFPRIVHFFFITVYFVGRPLEGRSTGNLAALLRVFSRRGRQESSTCPSFSAMRLTASPLAVHLDLPRFQLLSCKQGK